MRKICLSKVIASIVALCVTASAQQPKITGFGSNGTLTWTTSGTDAVYRVEWASSMTSEWHSSWVPLHGIRSKPGETITVGVPMFFRVVGSTEDALSAEELEAPTGPQPIASERDPSPSAGVEGLPRMLGTQPEPELPFPETSASPGRQEHSLSPTEGLIAWYDFRDGSVRDCSGYGNDGDPHGVVPAPDRRGTMASAMYFNGNNAWIEVKTSPLYDEVCELTLALWLRPIDDGRGLIEQNLISKQPSGCLSGCHSPGTSNHGGLFDLNLITKGGQSQIFFASQVSPGMVTQGYVAQQTTLPEGVWQHLAVTVSQAENRIRVYVNGVKTEDVVVTEHTHIGHILSQPNSEPLRIGKRKDADFGRRFFHGWMDDVRIYNRILQDQEVAAIAGRE